MYTVDERDRVLVLNDVPKSDVGAPLPALVSDERALVLLYIVSGRDPDWDGTYVRAVSPSSDGVPVAVVRFRRPACHTFGPPNDEAFEGHPLAGRGLNPYAAFEVENSSWVRQLERVNSVHPYHRPEYFASYRHFVFAFHDSTFECVAEGFGVSVERGSIGSALSRAAQSLSQ